MGSDASGEESPSISKESLEETSSKSEENAAKLAENPPAPEETTEEINEPEKAETNEENNQICDRETCKWAKEIQETTGEIEELDSKSKENAPSDVENIDGVEIETNIDITLEIKTNKTDVGRECVCGEEKKELAIECPCGKEESIEEEVEEEEPELKRFIILKKIPCRWSKQCEILKVSSIKKIINQQNYIMQKCKTK